MNMPQRHVIRRQSIELSFEGDESDGFAMQGKVAALCRDWVARALDETFARLVPADEHWRFERIEVDAGHFTPENFERDFASAVAAAVQARIQSLQERATSPGDGSGASATRRTDAQAIHEAFLFFLATGTLPWWFRLPEGRTLEQAVSGAWTGERLPAPLQAALPDVLAAKMARLRLVRQFSAAFLSRLLDGAAPGAWAILRESTEAPDRLATSADGPHEVPEDAWHAAFACLARGQAITGPGLRQAWAARAGVPVPPPQDAQAATTADTGQLAADHAIDSAAPSPARTSVPSAPDTDTDASDAAVSSDRTHEASDPAEGLFVDAAGVVLLHPFLPALFARLHLYADERLLQPDRALALLHFLATGSDRAPEYALALPKLLCGLDPAAPVGAPVELAAHEKAEAMALLDAVIGHWSALGDTSPGALRGTFLARPGKLSRRGDEDLLQLEPQAFDVLLGQLPWGIGTVFLPWMKRFLWVEWPF
jgi:hypothetical protein